MTTSDGLGALADRCEAATGPDRELDTGIAKALGLTDQRTHMSPQGLGYVDRNQWAVARVERYTASLDAAMTLVPEHISTDLFIASLGSTHCVLAGNGDHVSDAENWESYARAPALALCAAALRARAVQ